MTQFYFACVTICVAVATAGCGRPALKSKPRPAAAPSKARPPASLQMVSRPEPAAPVWRVVSVHDGDTLRAITEGKVEQRIRLHTASTPPSVGRHSATSPASGWPS